MGIFEDLAKERARGMIYPEACPEKESEVDLVKARYVVDEREFKFVPHGPSSYVDLSRIEEGVEYLLEPGAEGCVVDGIYDELIDIVNSVNRQSRFKIDRLWVRSSNHPFDQSARISPILGCPQIPYSALKKMRNDERKEYLMISLYHEAAHLSPDQENGKFKELWKMACELGIVAWFKDSNFLTHNNNASENAGHPEDSSAELYASAYMISYLARPQFNAKFYDSADAQQRKVIDEIFSFVDGVRK